jgi:hypothetical protein
MKSYGEIRRELKSTYLSREVLPKLARAEVGLIFCDGSCLYLPLLFIATTTID